MDNTNIDIEASDHTPKVAFDFTSNKFELRGMSYMEDVDNFYETLLKKLNLHLAELSGTTVTFDFDLPYFNSSSARAVFRLFEMLDAAAKAGNSVNINWHYGDDEDIAEQGEDLGEDLQHAKFVLIGDDL